MKATKVMGAVLAALLVLAVLVSAGAAVTALFPYTNLTKVTEGLGDGQLYPGYTLAYINNDAVTDIYLKSGNDGAAAYFTADQVKAEGDYSYSIAGKGSYTYKIMKSPDAALTLSVYDVAGSDIAGKTISKGSGMNITVQDPYIYGDAIDYLVFTTPSNGQTMDLGNEYGRSAATADYPISSGLTLTNWYDATGAAYEKYDNASKANIFSTGLNLLGNMRTLSDWNVKSGQWYVQVHIDNAVFAGTDYAIDGQMIPAQYCYGSTKYPFYVKGDEYAITADKDTIVRGNSFTLTISGPATTDSYNDIYGNAVKVTITSGDKGVNLLNGQNHVVYSDGTYDVKAFEIDAIPATGEVTVQIDTTVNTEDKKYKFTADFYNGKSTKDCSVKVVKGGVTIETDLEGATTYIGNEVHFFGTNTETDSVILMIKGVNKPLQEIYVQNPTADDSALGLVDVEADHTWDKKFTIANRFDAGTYTIYAIATDDAQYAQYKWGTIDYEDLVDTDDITYETCQLTLKKPFLTAVPSQTVVAKGDKVTIAGQVEGEPDQLIIYVLGTNFYGYTTVVPEDDGTYSKDITMDVDTGEYCVVVQHPMYDKLFNVQPAYMVYKYDASGNATDVANDNFYAYNGTDATAGEKQEWSILMSKSAGEYKDNFNILGFATMENDYQLVWRDALSSMDTRQKANAVVALTDLINEEYVDDLYVACDIQVGNVWLIVNAIADVKEGSEFTVDGTTNLKVDSQVSVEIMSQKFAGVSKIDVSDSAYMMGTTRVAKGDAAGNTWKVTFNNNKLNVDTYTVTAKGTSSSNVEASDTTTMNIVAKGAQPTAQPTSAPTTAPTTAPTAVPTATQTPTQSPGFGALIALAGLGAAAVLLLRRD